MLEPALADKICSDLSSIYVAEALLHIDVPCQSGPVIKKHTALHIFTAPHYSCLLSRLSEADRTEIQ